MREVLEIKAGQHLLGHSLLDLGAFAPLRKDDGDDLWPVSGLKVRAACRGSEEVF